MERDKHSLKIFRPQVIQLGSEGVLKIWRERIRQLVNESIMMAKKPLYLYYDERRDIQWNISWAHGKSQGRSLMDFQRA